MNIYNLMDWNGSDYSLLETIETNISPKQLKRIKKATDIIWDKQPKFCNGLENGDWSEILIKILDKLNIEYKLLSIENIY